MTQDFIVQAAAADMDLARANAAVRELKRMGLTGFARTVDCLVYIVFFFGSGCQALSCGTCLA